MAQCNYTIGKAIIFVGKTIILMGNLPCFNYIYIFVDKRGHTWETYSLLGNNYVMLYIMYMLYKKKPFKCLMYSVVYAEEKIRGVCLLEMGVIPIS